MILDDANDLLNLLQCLFYFLFYGDTFWRNKLCPKVTSCKSIDQKFDVDIIDDT